MLALLLSSKAEYIPSHVIAAFFQLNHGPATVTSLPPCLLRCLKKSIRFLILRAVLRTMPFSITLTANLRLAPITFAIFYPILLVDIAGLDPFATSSSRAVYPILRSVFLEFAVPIFLKIDIK
jgi:hypothetical protein